MQNFAAVNAVMHLNDCIQQGLDRHEELCLPWMYKDGGTQKHQPDACKCMFQYQQIYAKLVQCLNLKYNGDTLLWKQNTQRLGLAIHPAHANRIQAVNLESSILTNN